jgi:hypothetical protein
MGDAEQRDTAAAEVIDLESIRRLVVVIEEVSFTGTKPVARGPAPE